MTDEAKAPARQEMQWTEGAIVFEADGKPAKIGKVYKNGNFVLEGDKQRQQYRPWRDRASRTGDGWSRAWHRDTNLYPDTPENRERFARARKVKVAHGKVFKEAKRLDKIARGSDYDAILAEASRLAAAPDMAEALEELLAIVVDRAESQEEYDAANRANAILARAKGQEED